MFSGQLLKSTNASSVAAAFAQLVQCVQDRAVDMNASDLSNSIWAAATLLELEPELVKVVPSIATHIQQKADSLIPQQLSIAFGLPPSFKKKSRRP